MIMVNSYFSILPKAHYSSGLIFGFHYYTLLDHIGSNQFNSTSNEFAASIHLIIVQGHKAFQSSNLLNLFRIIIRQ
jgi:hypothetical protein